MVLHLLPMSPIMDSHHHHHRVLSHEQAALEACIPFLPQDLEPFLMEDFMNNNPISWIHVFFAKNHLVLTETSSCTGVTHHFVVKSVDRSRLRWMKPKKRKEISLHLSKH